MRPAANTRGPSTSPSPMASLTPTSVNHDPPGTEIAVTPARSTFCAFHAARMALSSGRVVPPPRASPGSLGWP